ncbi:hypothetical protein A0H76_381 [Hepatospora eriocheir]|uniref:Uncharacterized protein n=1 Tax=Hepatospora eriocheir TaxID=1081669 RepID=A0A1X0QBC6_9MICR|nr:hypothetical protein A0H76_381 [Hepatospora eriocheir]
MNISESEIMLLRYFLIMYNQNEKKKKDILKIIIKNFQSMHEVELFKPIKVKQSLFRSLDIFHDDYLLVYKSLIPMTINNDIDVEIFSLDVFKKSINEIIKRINIDIQSFIKYSLDKIKDEISYERDKNYNLGTYESYDCVTESVHMFRFIINTKHYIKCVLKEYSIDYKYQKYIDDSISLFYFLELNNLIIERPNIFNNIISYVVDVTSFNKGCFYRYKSLNISNPLVDRLNIINNYDFIKDPTSIS